MIDGYIKFMIRGENGRGRDAKEHAWDGRTVEHHRYRWRDEFQKHVRDLSEHWRVVESDHEAKTKVVHYLSKLYP